LAFQLLFKVVRALSLITTSSERNQKCDPKSGVEGEQRIVPSCTARPLETICRALRSILLLVTIPVLRGFFNSFGTWFSF
jgi:hypothetical protein